LLEEFVENPSAQSFHSSWLIFPLCQRDLAIAISESSWAFDHGTLTPIDLMEILKDCTWQILYVAKGLHLLVEHIEV
jgi:hypothetical protein